MNIINKVAAVVLGSSLSGVAFSAQICNDNMQQLAPDERYELVGSQAKDKRTGLVWQRCMVGQTWNDSAKSCDGSPIKRNWLNALQQVPEGWRLPNIKELVSLVNYGCANPAVNLTVFPTTPVGGFWSSTQVKRSLWANQPRNLVWSMITQDGTTHQPPGNFENHVRLVKK